MRLYTEEEVRKLSKSYEDYIDSHGWFLCDYEGCEIEGIEVELHGQVKENESWHSKHSSQKIT